MQTIPSPKMAEVGMEIHTLPCISGTPAVNDEVFDFRLLVGYSAETSGGLMICLPEENANAYMKDLEECDGCPSWIIGKVIPDAARKARLIENINVLEV